MTKNSNDFIDELSKVLGDKELTGLLTKIVGFNPQVDKTSVRQGDPLEERIYQQVRDGLRRLNPEQPRRYNWQHQDSGITIKFEVPGVEVADISVKVKEDLLSVKIGKDAVKAQTFTPGKRKFDKEQVKVTYKLGILTVVVPFVDEEKEFNEVKVETETN